MTGTMTPTGRGWRTIERYVYVERAYEDVWGWLAGHLSTLGEPLPGGGHAVDLRIRPGGMAAYSRPVRLRVGGLVATEDRARAALGWADVARPRLFPQLEAVLDVVAVPNDAAPFTQLGVLARYRPPLGALGALGDRMVGAEVTDAALTTFLDDLSEAVEGGTTPPSLAWQGEVRERGGEDRTPGLERVLLTVDGLAIRTGGAEGVCLRLLAVPGVTHVSIDPWVGLVAVDHDPTVCTSGVLAEALEGPTS